MKKLTVLCAAALLCVGCGKKPVEKPVDPNVGYLAIVNDLFLGNITLAQPIEGYEDSYFMEANSLLFCYESETVRFHCYFDDTNFEYVTVYFRYSNLWDSFKQYLFSLPNSAHAGETLIYSLNRRTIEATFGDGTYSDGLWVNFREIEILY